MSTETPPTAGAADASTAQPGSSPTRRALLAAAGLAAAGAGGWLAWHLQASGLAGAVANLPGDPLPEGFWDLSFDQPDGTPLDWKGLQGQGFILNFWATWCPPCVREMPELDRVHAALQPRGWRVVGLAVDSPTPVREFLGKVRVGFATGLAGFGGTELAKALGNTAGGLPFTVLVDAHGRIRQRKMGETHHDELMAWVADVEASTTKKL